MRKGAQTLVFGSKPVILSRAAIGGKKEGEGPLAAYFDFLGKDAKLGQKTFEGVGAGHGEAEARRKL